MRLWRIQTAKFYQLTYFKNILTSKFKSKDVLLWGRGFAFIRTGNVSLWIWIHSRLKKLDLIEEYPLKILATKKLKKNLNVQQDM